MASTAASKLERERRKTLAQEHAWERERLLYDRLLTPAVIRTALVAGIIAYSTHVARSPQNQGPVQSALAFALPGIGIPLIAAEAGIRDRWALAAISSAGVGYVTGQMLSGWQSVGLLPDSPADFWNDLTTRLPSMLTPWKD
jgi:hypothetical protein